MGMAGKWGGGWGGKGMRSAEVWAWEPLIKQVLRE